MREIKLRGKRKDDGEWVYGNHYGTGQESLELFWMDVADDLIDASTIGQFTGLLSKSGQEIYEGDIVKEHSYFDVYTIVFEEGRFCCQSPPWMRRQHAIYPLSVEVVGNIHENSELIQTQGEK